MKKKNRLFILSLISILFTWFGTGAVEASTLKFYVEPQIPENQINKEASYFDLAMKPGEEQIIKTTLINDTEQEVVVEVGKSMATTNLNGVVEYSKNEIKKDESLKYDFSDLVVGEDEVTIPAQSEVDYELTIQMPKESYQGIIAGGLTFIEKEKEQADKEEEENSLAIENRFALVIAVLLHEGDVDSIEKNILLTDVGAAQVNLRNVIEANLQNPEAIYINNLAVDARVYPKGSKEVLYEAKTLDMQMAPNTNFSYPISLNGEEIEAGEYILDMVVYGDQDEAGKYVLENNDSEEKRFEQQWKFSKEFTVTAKEAKELNANDVTIENSNRNWIYYAVGGLLLLVVVLLFIIFRNKRQQQRPRKPVSSNKQPEQKNGKKRPQKPRTSPNQQAQLKKRPVSKDTRKRPQPNQSKNKR